jgi:L-asparaginase
VGQKIVVLGTGGTIAGTASNPTDSIGYKAAQVGVESLLSGIEGAHSVTLIAEQVAQADSKDMSFEIWRSLAARCHHWLAQPGVQGIVITHGTDTLEETAFFLHQVLPDAKPVVLTCAMRPATAVMADGPQNLLDAIAVASTPGAHGVVVVCAGAVHGAVDVYKSHPYRLDAFSSGDLGPIGYVEEGRLRLGRNWPTAPSHASTLAVRVAGTTRWPRVEIVMNHAGADGAIVRALQAAGVDAVVAAGTGNGTLSRDLEQALLDAQAAGVRVLRASRCSGGRVIGHAGDALDDSRGLSPVKARIALLLELMA